jgi:hypothetical protein
MSFMASFSKYQLPAPFLLGIFSLALLASETSLARGNDAPVELKGGSITVDLLTKKKQSTASTNKFGQSIFLDFGFNAAGFAGDFTVNALGQTSTSDFKHKYGDRINGSTNGKNIEVYNFSATRLGDKLDLHLFYHTPRYHWGYEGDFFGLMEEATDMAGQDVWNAKAPQGLELTGKDSLDGLKIVAGDEIYWGAKQMIMVKYQFGENKQYTFMANGDTSEGSDSRQLSLQGTFNLPQSSKLTIGMLRSGNAKVGEAFDYYKNGVAYSDTVTDKDTLAFKGRFMFPVKSNVEAYAGFNYAGLVADAGENLKEMGSELPYSKLGNKTVFELGAKITNGNYMLTPRLMVRDNLIGANPSNIGGIDQRNIVIAKDPFVVTDNRKTRAAELVLTFDPTPSSFFYEWDNDLKEDAPLAYNIGITYVDYQLGSDAATHWDPQGWFWPDKGIMAGETVGIKSRIVINNEAGNKIITNMASGYQKEYALVSGNPIYDYTKFVTFEAKYSHQAMHSYSVKYAKNKVGEYDADEEWGVKYPETWELGYERHLDANKSSERRTFGAKLRHRSLDADSGDDYASGANKRMTEIQVSYTHKF